MSYKLIILTTSIIRPELHNESIGLFYNKYYKSNETEINNKFTVYHIINIDQPKKLKNHFTLEETIENFNNIIPKNINKIYITPEEPSFLCAFKNIMYKIRELNLISDESIYWWFEDDWIGTNNLDFFNIITFVLNFKNSALTMTSNCQLGSFRGGPIMNNYFFTNYFDIETIGIMNNTCDPERQISKYLSGKGEIIINKSTKIKRKLINDYENEITLILIYFDTDYSNITADFGISYYNLKFNENINFKYYIVKINDYDFENIEYINYINNEQLKNKNNYIKITYDDFINLNKTNSITYLIIKPYCFEDCGRDFSQKYNLIKGWKKIGDPITYS